MVPLETPSVREAGRYEMALSSSVERAPRYALYETLGFEKHGYNFRIRP